MSRQDILCRIWLHKWGKFSAVKMGNYTNTSNPYFHQSRICEHCGKFQERIKDR